MIAALDRPAHRDHGPRRRHAPGKAADGVGIDTGNLRRPVGILRHAVRLADQIGVKPVKPGAVPADEVRIMQTLGDQGIGKAEHNRGIGIGPGGQPVGAQLIEKIIAHRADLHEFQTGGLRIAQIILGFVAGEAVLRHLAVLGRHPAE